MKVPVVIFALIACSLAAPKANKVANAVACDPDVCQLPACRCSGTDIPGDLEPENIPQLVFLTFDDAVTNVVYEEYKDIFYGRVNPDGCPIGVTLFASHEYTDYSKVHDLHAHGHDIALHSISHLPYTDYWVNLSVEELDEEFGGERELVAHFADIPIEDIKGLRLPLLQLAGDNTFESMVNTGLEWDCSWPTRQYTEPGLWPYTLDYASDQDCTLGSCPTSSIPGKWVVPMLMWEDNEGVPCSMVDACVNIPEDVDGIFEFAKRNFLREYNTNRAPFGFYIHEAWYKEHENTYAAYVKFVDYLQTLPDVYIVGISRGLEWVKNPQPLSNLSESWPTCQATREPNCKAASCQLTHPDGPERYMTVCGKCPHNYPWLGNPLGV